jgi:low affinity Fe/Cu permease
VVARATGRPATFIACLLMVIVWGVTGPLFHFSDTWQLVINTGTTIVTFLMVFLIQNTQNRESAAIQAKLNELLHAVSKADVRFVGIEHLTDRQLENIIAECEKRAGPAADAVPLVKANRKPPRKLSRRLTPSEHAEPAGGSGAPSPKARANGARRAAASRP